MARKILFPKQIIARFQPNATFGGLYAAGFNFPESGFGGNIADSFELVVGNTYIVDWDGAEYNAAAQDASTLAPGLIGLGNGAAFGLSGNNEPFIVALTNGMGFNLVSFDQAASHEVGIYEDVADEEPEEPETPPEEPEEPEGIVLKDRNGNDVAYYGIETVTFDTTTDGKQQTFTKGEAVEGLEIEPDFSGGDMAVVAPDGKLVKSATIKKPEALVPENIREGANVGGVVGSAFVPVLETAEVELDFAAGDQTVVPSATDKVLTEVVIRKPETLVPENIAEGIEVAGIVGTMAAGGLGAKIAFGDVPKSSNITGTITIDHNLGVVPDIVIVQARTAASAAAIKLLVGFSEAFYSKYPMAAASLRVLHIASQTANYVTSTWGIDRLTSGPMIHNATNSQFSINSSDYYLPSSEAQPGTWIAIGGLT